MNVYENWLHLNKCIHFLDTFETCPRARLRQVTPGYGGSPLRQRSDNSQVQLNLWLSFSDIC